MKAWLIFEDFEERERRGTPCGGTMTFSNIVKPGSRVALRRIGPFRRCWCCPLPRLAPKFHGQCRSNIGSRDIFDWGGLCSGAVRGALLLGACRYQSVKLVARRQSTSSWISLRSFQCKLKWRYVSRHRPGPRISAEPQGSRSGPRRRIAWQFGGKTLAGRGRILVLGQKLVPCSRPVLRPVCLGICPLHVENECAGVLGRYIKSLRTLQDEQV